MKDLAAAEDWIGRHVTPSGPLELLRERPWSTVYRVPLDGGVAWFKACAPVQAFEPRLCAGLAARWPGRVADVLGHDEERAWLLLADAGTMLGEQGNPPETWMSVLPLYAELQRGEVAHAADHLAHDVPDRRTATLPALYDDFVSTELPLEPDELNSMRAFAPRLGELCSELAARGIPDTIQHDDLHMKNVYESDGRLRVLDWGDSSIAHPFASLVVTFRFLEELSGLAAGDPWFERLRDAYLEPWGDGLADTFALAHRVGTFAHVIGWARIRTFLPPDALPDYDQWFRVVLGRALANIPD
ncbi:MAG TPA: hypothetical protein VH817_17955 [Thermoleophilaceae bacterium]